MTIVLPIFTATKERKRIGNRARPEMLQRLCEKYGDDLENVIKREHIEESKTDQDAYACHDQLDKRLGSSSRRR